MAEYSDKATLHGTTPVSEKKTYNTPILRDLDGIEKTEGGAVLFVLESSGGVLTS